MDATQVRTSSRFFRILLVAPLALAACASPDPEVGVSACPLAAMKLVNDRWIATHASPGNNKWARAVYFTGNMAAYETVGDQAYLDYAVDWAEGHGWGLLGGNDTRDADRQCAGQTYLALHELAPESAEIGEILTAVESMVVSTRRDDWSWVDAFYMAMPVFARLGALLDDPRYFDASYELYQDAKVRQRLYEPDSGLWYRDETYIYPDDTTPSGKRIFWSRGNGWVIGALVRTLDYLPEDSSYRAEYLAMLRTMAVALAARQRADGFWNVSLDDPEHFGGPETSGTALFVYGLAWGVRHGELDRASYAPVIERAWRAMTERAVWTDGTLGYVQGVGEAPSDEQPVGIESTADYGVGAFLLAGSEVARLGLIEGC